MSEHFVQLAAYVVLLINKHARIQMYDLQLQVQKWTMPRQLKRQGQSSESILDCDRVILPVHQGMHWVSKHQGTWVKESKASTRCAFYMYYF